MAIFARPYSSIVLPKGELAMPCVSDQAYVEAARTGHVVALPTDTVWGVAVVPEHSSKLYALKQRSLEKSLILMGATAADLWPYVVMDKAQWQSVTTRYWPGQLTLVVPASDRVPLGMHPQTPETIGVRVPDHPVARQILALTGPLATTSANISGQPNLMSLDEVLTQFPQVYGFTEKALKMFLELGNFPEKSLVPSGSPSTVARWQPHGWEILRQGTVHL
ncbi:MAG: L-threonylcarbamoyladenylate synthase [Cyanobacteria bacterium P01_D01_bin.156]